MSYEFHNSIMSLPEEIRVILSVGHCAAILASIIARVSTEYHSAWIMWGHKPPHAFCDEAHYVREERFAGFSPAWSIFET